MPLYIQITIRLLCSSSKISTKKDKQTICWHLCVPRDGILHISCSSGMSASEGFSREVSSIMLLFSFYCSSDTFPPRQNWDLEGSEKAPLIATTVHLKASYKAALTITAKKGPRSAFAAILRRLIKSQWKKVILLCSWPFHLNLLFIWSPCFSSFRVNVGATSLGMELKQRHGFRWAWRVWERYDFSWAWRVWERYDFSSVWRVWQMSLDEQGEYNKDMYLYLANK